MSEPNDSGHVAEKPEKEYMQEINELNQYMKAINDSAFSYSILMDRNGVVLYYSDSLLKLAKISDKKAFIGIPIVEAYEKLFNDKDFVSQAIRRFSRIMSGENEFYEDDVVTWPSGEKSIYRIAYKRIEGESNGFDGIFLFTRDITDIRMEEANRRISDLLHSTTLPCLIWDENGNITEFNKEFVSTFNVPEDLPPDRLNEFFDIIQPESQAEGINTEKKRQGVLLEALEKGFSQSTVWLKSKGGAPICCMVNITRISWMFGYRLVAYYCDQTDIMTKEALARKADERVKLMLDAAPLGCFFIDDDFGIIDCNDELMRIFDVKSKNLITDDFFRFSPEIQPNGRKSRSLAAEYIDKARLAGSITFEWMHQSYTGEPIPAEVTLACIKHDSDFAIICYARDLREYKKIMAEANEANERAKLMLNATPFCCTLWDEDFHCIDCNEEFLKLFEIEEKSEYLEGFLDFSPEYQPDGKLSKTKVQEVMNKTYDEGRYVFDWMHQLRDGTPVPSEITLVRIKYANRYVIAGYTRDLREYERLMKDEKESRALMNKSVAILENVDALISVTDLDFNLIYMNQNLANAFGLNRDDCIGKKCYKAMRNHDAPCSICRLPELLPDIDALPTILDEYLWDEVLGMWTESKASIIRWVDDSLVLFHSINDRSVKKAYEDELLKAMEASVAASASKTAFLANMSHEVRTPMNSIIGFAELALDGEIPSKTGDYLNRIIDSAKWLLHIINDILDISKIESGKIELDNAPFDLEYIISCCQSVILPSANEKGLELLFYVEPPGGKKLLGDSVRLYQVLMNLLSNAIKFTISGKVELSAAIKSSDDESVTVCFKIKDSGIGMTSEQMKRIFEPFMQADSSTTRNYGGTGLGLAIAKNFVELMGGELAVESELGAGSTFVFELCFKTIDMPADAPDHIGLNTVKKPSFKGLIMVCEDNHMNQQVICEHLARVGLQTVVAENGRIGVEMVQERALKGLKPFDLIFMDMFMPVMNGIEAAAKIVALDTGTPIVAMTANIMTSDIEAYKENGMTDFVGKPFTSQELWHCLLKYLAPIGVSDVYQDEQRQDDDLQRKLKIGFVRSNQGKFDEINESILSDKLSLAHRLAHSLKTNAGLIGKNRLQSAAAEVEALLKDGAIPTASQMSVLENELNAVIEELEPMLDECAEKEERAAPSSAQISELFAKLEPMLKGRNTECLKLLDDIRAIPGAETLSRQIEKYDFRLAAQTLSEIKKKLV